MCIFTGDRSTSAATTREYAESQSSSPIPQVSFASSKAMHVASETSTSLTSLKKLKWAVNAALNDLGATESSPKTTVRAEPSAATTREYAESQSSSPIPQILNEYLVYDSDSDHTAVRDIGVAGSSIEAGALD